MYCMLWPSSDSTGRTCASRHRSFTAKAKEREWVWKLDAMAKRLLQIDRALKAIERDARVIREHCTATDEQIDAAIEAYAKRLDRAAMNALAVELYYAQLGEARKEVKPAFRQLLLHYRPRT